MSQESAGLNLRMGRADVLFRFLQLVGLDKPSLLQRYVSSIAADGTETITEQVANAILSENPEFYSLYAQAQKEVGKTNPYSSTDEIVKAQPESGFETFFSLWIALETGLTELIRIAQISQGRNSQRPITQSEIRSLDVFDIDAQSSFDRIRRIRNDWVHGRRVPNAGEIQDATNALEGLVKKLEARNDWIRRGITESSESFQRSNSEPGYADRARHSSVSKLDRERSGNAHLEIVADQEGNHLTFLSALSQSSKNIPLVLGLEIRNSGTATARGVNVTVFVDGIQADVSGKDLILPESTGRYIISIRHLRSRINLSQVKRSELDEFISVLNVVVSYSDWSEDRTLFEECFVLSRDPSGQLRGMPLTPCPPIHVDG